MPVCDILTHQRPFLTRNDSHRVQVLTKDISLVPSVGYKKIAKDYTQWKGIIYSLTVNLGNLAGAGWSEIFKCLHCLEPLIGIYRSLEDYF